MAQNFGLGQGQTFFNPLEQEQDQGLARNMVLNQAQQMQQFSMPDIQRMSPEQQAAILQQADDDIAEGLTEQKAQRRHMILEAIGRALSAYASDDPGRAAARMIELTAARKQQEEQLRAQKENLQEQLKSDRELAIMREEGATERTEMTESGQDRRLGLRLDHEKDLQSDRFEQEEKMQENEFAFREGFQELAFAHDLNMEDIKNVNAMERDRRQGIITRENQSYAATLEKLGRLEQDLVPYVDSPTDAIDLARKIVAGEDLTSRESVQVGRLSTEMYIRRITANAHAQAETLNAINARDNVSGDPLIPEPIRSQISRPVEEALIGEEAAKLIDARRADMAMLLDDGQPLTMAALQNMADRGDFDDPAMIETLTKNVEEFRYADAQTKSALEQTLAAKSSAAKAGPETTPEERSMLGHMVDFGQAMNEAPFKIPTAISGAARRALNTLMKEADDEQKRMLKRIYGGE